MKESEYHELYDTIQPYIENGILIDHKGIWGAQNYINANIDELLAWLPTFDYEWTLIHDKETGSTAELYQRDGHRYYSKSGATMPKAILRCWLAWKMQEKE